MTVVSPRIVEKFLQLSVSGSGLLQGKNWLHRCRFTGVPVAPIMELFRTIVPPRKNVLHAGHLPAKPVLTSLARALMMRSMYRRTTCMQPVLIVMNTTIVRRLVPG